MAGSAWAETRRALLGTLILARGDAQGMVAFDTSLDGFWRSFRAALICFPFYMLLVLGRLDEGSAAAASGVRVATVETIGYVISWTAFPLIILNLCRWLGRNDRFLAFMVAYNWCQVPQIVLFAAIALVGKGGLPTGVAHDGLALAAAIASLVYEWFVARVALNATVIEAVLVVIVDLLLATILSQVSDSLY